MPSRWSISTLKGMVVYTLWGKNPIRPARYHSFGPWRWYSSESKSSDGCNEPIAISSRNGPAASANAAMARRVDDRWLMVEDSVPSRRCRILAATSGPIPATASPPRPRRIGHAASRPNRPRISVTTPSPASPRPNASGMRSVHRSTLPSPKARIASSPSPTPAEAISSAARTMGRRSTRFPTCVNCPSVWPRRESSQSFPGTKYGIASASRYQRRIASDLIVPSGRVVLAASAFGSGTVTYQANQTTSATAMHASAAGKAQGGSVGAWRFGIIRGSACRR